MSFVNIQKLKVGNYITVKVTDNFVENGKNLMLAYQEAENLNPGGSAKSSTNRVSVIIPPGNYNLGSLLFSIHANYVDVVTLESGQKEPSVLISSTVGVTVSASDCKIIGIKSDIFEIGVSNPNQYFENCEGGLSAFGGDGATASGTFINCVGGNNSFGGDGGIASGNFINCIGGILSFGGAGFATGYFKDCEGGNNSFGKNGTASGKFINCKAPSFQLLTAPASGKALYINCIDANDNIIQGEA
jgi:hypothetical protein